MTGAKQIPNSIHKLPRDWATMVFLGGFAVGLIALGLSYLAPGTRQADTTYTIGGLLFSLFGLGLLLASYFVSGDRVIQVFVDEIIYQPNRWQKERITPKRILEVQKFNLKPKYGMTYTVTTCFQTFSFDNRTTNYEELAVSFERLTGKPILIGQPETHGLSRIAIGFCSCVGLSNFLSKLFWAIIYLTQRSVV